MLRFCFIVGLLIALSGCNVARQVSAYNARNDMEASKAAYKNCLLQHPDNIEACNSAKLVYQADVKAYSVQTGQQVTVDVNAQ